MPFEELLLCLDLGNTRLAGGVFDGGNLMGEFRLPTPIDPGELAGRLELLLPAGVFPQATLCSVSPSGAADLVPHLRRMGFPVRQIRGETPVPFPVKIRTRHTLGADRLCNVAAAWSRNLFPTVIIDAGTAVTFDIVDDDGVFVGGVIFPGRRLLSTAMAHGGEMLMESGKDWPPVVVGDDTISALTSGTHWGLLGACEGIVRHIDRETGLEHRVILTGGDAADLGRRWLEGEPLVEPDLTLEGVAILAAAGVGEPVGE